MIDFLNRFFGSWENLLEKEWSHHIIHVKNKGKKKKIR